MYVPFLNKLVIVILRCIVHASVNAIKYSTQTNRLVILVQSTEIMYCICSIFHRFGAPNTEFRSIKRIISEEVKTQSDLYCLVSFGRLQVTLQSTIRFTQRNLFKILLNQPKIIFYLQFSD